MLVALASASAAACVRPALRPVAPTPAELPPEVDHWHTEARGILSDGLETLQTFEVFAAFRLALASQSDRRSQFELAWDPPSRMGWDQAVHVARAAPGRADQLQRSIVNAHIDGALWRVQRDSADAAAALIDLGEAMDSYRARVVWAAPASDGTADWGVLDRAWQKWQDGASRWGVARAESIPCSA